MNLVTASVALVGGAILASAGCSQPLQANAPPSPPARQQQFGALLEKHRDLTGEELAAQVPARTYLEQLSFDPAEASFYAETVERLQLTEAEQALLRKQGLVSVDHGQRYSFGSLYFAIYTADLPVLVTSDSILHAMHRSYDDLLMETEETFLTAALEEVLGKCHAQLGDASPRWGAVAANHQDVDLYLTVARNLLKGAGAPAGERMHPSRDVWDGTLLVNSALGQDEAAIELLKRVQSHAMESAQRSDLTKIYGGERPIDYSQFKPRGHYEKSTTLSRYFRAMMWLGRADTGWNVLPPAAASGIMSDSARELRNAVLLTQLIESSGAVERLRQMNDILDLMVGESDNLTPLQTLALVRRQKIGELADLTASNAATAFQQAIGQREEEAERIRSQAVLSDPNDARRVPPPVGFQMFGQRFILDSFVLSKVVFDEITFDGAKVNRTMPTGLDVMFALGNETALPLLREELERWPYAANLQAARQFVAQQPESTWGANLYNIWLDAIRTLDDDLTAERQFPEAMRTEAWQRKQLQAQLASWAELRHNTVLYAKQAYTAQNSCVYPTGYVEPYPELYARVKFFAEEAARRIAAAEYHLSTQGYDFRKQQTQQVEFLKQMAVTVGRLETLARKELAAEPFSVEDQAWLKKVIDIRGGGSGRPRYDGWYCQLFYGGGHRAAEWDPTVIDVHTDPNSREVLEEGVGSCNFLVLAIDNEEDRTIYVGPAYSYYEFRQPGESRLTDIEWQRMLAEGKAPPRPGWTEVFQGTRVERMLAKP